MTNYTNKHYTMTLQVGLLIWSVQKVSKF